MVPTESNKELRIIGVFGAVVGHGDDSSMGET